ncbi:MAG: hypothetical protein KDA79_01750 [Planctomycetaceae bacterium]|nr:hypothetical protein [Planctomycetaceae bacterium]
MSIGPLLPGRMPAALLTSRLQMGISTAREMISRLQDQASTGQKFFVASEAPAAALRTISLQREIERKDQMLVNIAADQSLLGATESSLASVADSLNQARSLLSAGIGESTTSAEKEALAVEAAALLRNTVNAANTQFRDRYLFGGSQSKSVPFTYSSTGSVRYNGDTQNIDSFIDLQLQMSNSVDGATAFNALSQPVTADINPALALETRLSDLHGGRGISPGTIQVSVVDGTTSTQLIDLSGAETIGDVKNRIEAAFGSGPPGLTVSLAGPPDSGSLLLTPSGGGTVAVSNTSGTRTASDLGIAGTAATSITGSDLNPQLKLSTKLTALNGGNGVAATAGKGLLVTLDDQSYTIDLDGLETVEDLLNAFQSTVPDLAVGINSTGDGLAISSRLSGAGFSIGENGETSAADLGIRTLTGATLLDDLNGGFGTPLEPPTDDAAPRPTSITIQRRDGTSSVVELGGLKTVQQVMDAISAVDGNLSASLNAVGNGISITDSSGTGPLSVETSDLSTALGLSGTEPGPDNTVALSGADVNPQEPEGVLGLLSRLERALRDEDDRELERLAPLIDAEITRVNGLRGEVGLRLQTLDATDNRLRDGAISLQESLSLNFDADLTEVVTQVTQVSSTLDATLRIASQSMQLSLLNYL